MQHLARNHVFEQHHCYFHWAAQLIFTLEMYH